MVRYKLTSIDIERVNGSLISERSLFRMQNVNAHIEPQTGFGKVSIYPPEVATIVVYELLSNRI